MTARTIHLPRQRVLPIRQREAVHPAAAPVWRGPASIAETLQAERTATVLRVPVCPWGPDRCQAWRPQGPPGPRQQSAPGGPLAQGAEHARRGLPM